MIGTELMLFFGLPSMTRSLTTAATSGAFRPASDHIETKTRSDLQQRDRVALYLTDRARTHQELKVERSRFPSFAAS
jgi:hypothetical protein